MYHLDRTRIYGREIEVEFARGDRKSMSSFNFSVYILCLFHIKKIFHKVLLIAML